MNEIICNSAAETLLIGEKLSKSLKGGEIIGLGGELGTGKTVFVKGVMRGLGYNGYVKSPTFTIVNQYNTPELRVIHMDIYRLSSFEELKLIGFESYLSPDTILLIEWFDKFTELVEYPHIKIEFEYLNESVRRLRFHNNSSFLLPF